MHMRPADHSQQARGAGLTSLFNQAAAIVVFLPDSVDRGDGAVAVPWSLAMHSCMIRLAASTAR